LKASLSHKKSRLERSQRARFDVISVILPRIQCGEIDNAV
jgi:hypothetical protein